MGLFWLTFRVEQNGLHPFGNFAKNRQVEIKAHWKFQKTLAFRRHIDYNIDRGGGFQ
jgi:hypothetical protein